MAIMLMDDLEVFRTTILVENPALPGVTLVLPNVVVDTGSEYTWLPQSVLEALSLVPIRAMRFIRANGRQIERAVCFGNIYAGGSSAPDVLVFATDGDIPRLGAHTLEGLNLRIDRFTNQLVPAGPVPAAEA